MNILIFRKLSSVSSFTPSLATALILWAAAHLAAVADEIRMQNGDTYYGQVLSFNGQTLLLQSDMLGTVKVPRAKVSGITFGAGPSPAGASLSLRTNQTLHTPGVLSATNSPTDLTQAFRELGANSNLLQQFQAQLLAEGGPQAKNKFNDLLGGLMSGKLDLNGLRAEAKSAADQARAARKDLGEDVGAVMDGYLAILDGFLQEMDSAKSSTTNSIAPALQPANTR